MNNSFFLSIILVVILVPGILLSIPSISLTGSLHMQQVFAQYDEYRYSDGGDNDYKKPYDKKNFAEIERFDDKLFVCDNGIIVDDRTQCPLECPFGTTLEGAYVIDLDICDIEPGTASKKCPQGTDLEDVLVMNKNQCDLFAECDADSQLGLSLGGLEPIKVADVQLCQLSSPDIEICDSGFFEGFAVDSQQICNTVFDDVDVCGPTTDLAGMLTTDTNSCNIFETCLAGSPLGVALGGNEIDVTDLELCNLEIPEQIEVFVCDLDTPMSGAVVTHPLLCQAPNDDNKCPADTDLEGTYVMNPASDCNIFAMCDAGTALGKALGMQNEFKVADEVLCDLKVPEEIELFQCIGGPMKDAIVTDEKLCETPNSDNKCPPNTDLEGTYVMNPQTQCNLNLQEPFECPDSGFLVNDEANCPQKCPDGKYIMQGMECPPSSISTGQLTVFKEFIGCVDETNSTISCPEDVPSESGDFTISIIGNNANPSVFPGDDVGTVVSIEPGAFAVSEEQVTSPAPNECNSVIGAPFNAGADLGNNQFICTNFIESCDGIISSDDELTCIIENTIAVLIIQDIQPLTVTKNWFICTNNNLVDCTADTFNKQSIEPTFEGPTSNLYMQCTSEEECQFTSAANFDITISGNNPNPNNIDAVAGTMQDVDIDAGQYSVSEILEGQQKPFISVFDRLEVGDNPIRVAYAQDKMLMYVTNIVDDTVSILNTTGGVDGLVGNADDVVGTVDVGTNPRGIAYAQDKMLMYVVNSFDNTVSILNTTGGADGLVGNADDVVGTVDVGNLPVRIAYAQDKMLMYVTNFNDNTVTILNTTGGPDNDVETDDVVGTVDVGNDPQSIAYAQDKMLMYVANADDDTVTILNTTGGPDNDVETDDVVGTVDVGGFPRGMAYAQDKMLMYVANTGDDTVTILNTTGGPDNDVETDDVVGTVDVGDNPQGIAYAQDKMLMYVANGVDDTVTILNTTGGPDNDVETDDVVGTVDVGNGPQGIAYAQDKMLMYVANAVDNTVTILNATGGDDGTAGNSDDVINTNSLEVDVGDKPQGIAYAQDKMLMYVANAGDNTVTILNATGGDDGNAGNADDVVGTVDVGNNPQDLAYAQDKMLMYVANADDDTVTILNTTGGPDNDVETDDVVGTVNVGELPQGMAYAQDKMLMYVTNAGDNAVTILNTTGGPDNDVETDDVVGTVNVGGFPRGIAYAQDKMLMYVTNTVAGTVTILNTTGGPDNDVETDDVVGTVNVGDAPLGIAYAQDKMLMYVANAGDNTVTILNTTGGPDNDVETDDVVGTVNVGEFPLSIAYAQDKMLMYVGNARDGTVTILNTTGGPDNDVETDDVVGTVDVGNDPQSIAYAQDKMLMYVANSDADTTSIISIPTIEQACQNSGFDIGDIRTFESGQETLQQITCVNFSEQCNGDIQDIVTETQQCIIDDYAVIVNELS